MFFADQIAAFLLQVQNNFTGYLAGVVKKHAPLWQQTGEVLVIANNNNGN